MERYKAREALVSEVIKRRAEKLSQLWDEFDSIRSRSVDLVFAIAQIRNEAAKEVDRSEAAEGKTKRWKEHPYPPVEAIARPRIEREILPEVDVIRKRTERMKGSISRFWIGQQNAQRLVNHCITLDYYLKALRELDQKLVDKYAVELREVEGEDVYSYLQLK